MKQRKPASEPWPPPELSLPNLDTIERLSRGEQPEPEQPSPHDTQTRAKCQLSLPLLPGTRTSTTEAPR